MRGFFSLFFDERQVQRILSTKTRRAQFRVRNPGESIGRVYEFLERKGLEWKTSPWDSSLLSVDCSTRFLLKSEICTDGLVVLQGWSSCIPVQVLQPFGLVLDACAAPGNKTLQILDSTPKETKVVAVDLNQQRITRLHRKLAGVPLERIAIVHGDATAIGLSSSFFKDSTASIPVNLILKNNNKQKQQKQQQGFDCILVDAPCTGTGTIANWQDQATNNILSNKTLSQQRDIIHKFASRQFALLRAAYSVLKPGGTLVYSTCSVLPQENEDVLGELLGKYRDLSLCTDGIPSELMRLNEPLKKGDVLGEKTIRIFPSDDFEGFFIARLRKK